MGQQLAIGSFTENSSISPFLEMGAYEALWDESGATFKRIADMFREHPGSVPSDFVEPTRSNDYAKRAIEIAIRGGVHNFGVRVHGAGEYPEGLRDARHPVEVIYYQGWWDLISSPAVAVVGSRSATIAGLKRAAKIARMLVDAGYTVVSGLAAGIDTAAHTAAIQAGGKTIGVLGTPLSSYYPKENVELQRQIRNEFLLVSQVPFVRHSKQNPRTSRVFFPERNKVMSALTLATVIVEAGETSGTLVQARAALEQGRKLFILESCFNNPAITWPRRFVDMGAHRISDFAQITELLQD